MYKNYKKHYFLLQLLYNYNCNNLISKNSIMLLCIDLRFIFTLYQRKIRIQKAVRYIYIYKYILNVLFFLLVKEDIENPIRSYCNYLLRLVMVLQGVIIHKIK